MQFELIGFGRGFSLSFPVRFFGYVLLFLEAFIISGAAYSVLRDPERRADLNQALRAPLFIVLLIAAPFAAETFLIRLPVSGLQVTPGLPQGVQGPVFAIFGALPWLIAAGVFGPIPAMLVALLTGFTRAGFETHSLLTPLIFMLWAGFTAWLLRREYIEWPGKIFRNPLTASLMGAVLYGFLRILEDFSYSGGGFYDGLDFSLTLLPATMVAAVIESGIAGVIVFWLVRSQRLHWYQPSELRVGPYNRSLAARLVSLFLVIGVISSAVLLIGDWLFVQSSARQQLESQMLRTAGQAGGAVPYFVQTGRSVQNQIATLINQKVETGSLTQEDIQDLVRTYSFFRAIAIYDTQADRVYVYPQEGGFGEGAQFELSASLESALTGIPQEVILRPSQEGQTAQMAFLSPINSVSDGRVIGVVVGITDLGTNPYLLPVVEGFEQITTGQAFITDLGGTVLIHTNPDRILEEVPITDLPPLEVVSEIAPDGTRQLVLIDPVDGYPWNVVVVVPQSEVQRQSIRIATNLFAVQIAVGAVVLLSVYGISRRLTNPLRMMASVAGSIALGNLAQPIRGGGEDEIGQLAASFEQMRLGLKSRLEEMSLLLIASQEVASSLDLSQALPPILRGIQELTGADLVRLVLDEATEPDEVFSAGTDPGGWNSLDHQVMELCRPKRRLVLENPARARAVLDLNSLRRPIEALTVTALKNEEQYVGVLWLGYSVPHTFTQDELRLLSILSAQLGVAVSNARLYHQAERERIRLSAILETTPDAVILVDRHGMISLANPAAEIVLSASVDEVLGKSVEENVSSDDLLELIYEGGADTRSAEIQLEDGRVLFAYVSSLPSEGGGELGLVCVLWDLTHYKKLDMLKSEFVSTVSHDLRAPLTLMRGYATMLTMVGAMNDQQKEFVSKILASADQMGTLIDNLLDLGRIEEGVRLDLEQVEVEMIIEQALESFRPQAVNKQISLSTEIADDMIPIEADATLLRQAIANLVDNALKYTPAKGSVVVSANQMNGHQHIQVTDTGLGIAPTDQARLFEKFYRARRQESLQVKGTGLGLAIVKSIVEQHGGRVTLESKLGSGSTFTIDIPIQQAVREDQPESAEER